MIGNDVAIFELSFDNTCISNVLLESQVGLRLDRV